MQDKINDNKTYFSFEHMRDYTILRVLVYQSVCPFRIGSPREPFSQASVSPLLEPKGGGQHLLAGEGGASSDDWRESLALCLFCGAQYFKVNMKLSVVYKGGLIAMNASDNDCSW